MQRRHQGFTLVEIAIVLVIIALLLGGILKGQELITSAKIRNLAGDFTAIASAVYGYQERFKALPGDDGAASARWGASVPNGDRNGSIDGEFCADPAIAVESILFWRHLRLAGLIGGEASLGEQAPNALGGVFGAQSGAGPSATPELAGAVICASNLNGKIAAALDAQLDDGKPQSGTMRAYGQNRLQLARGCGSNPARASAVQTGYDAVDDGELYTLCKTL